MRKEVGWLEANRATVDRAVQIQSTSVGAPVAKHHSVAVNPNPPAHNMRSRKRRTSHTKSGTRASPSPSRIVPLISPTSTKMLSAELKKAAALQVSRSTRLLYLARKDQEAYEASIPATSLDHS